MKRILNNKWLYILTLTIGILWVNKKIVQNPEKFIVTSGDGLKNYFTYMYHIKNDSSFFQFEGMNYPYGDHIIFTDNQPIIVVTLKWLSNIFPQITCQSVHIHNWLLVLGMILGAIGLFLCFEKLGLSMLWSLLFAFGLIMIHPQFDRMNGHFALSYPSIPWYFYFWLTYWKSGKAILPMLGTAVMMSVMGLIHMYHFIIGAVLILTIIVADILIFRHKLKVKELTLFFIFGVIIPYFLIHFISNIGDAQPWRPQEPWGFFAHRSFIEGLVFHENLPIYKFINDNIVNIRQVNFEGKAYVGMLGVVMIVLGFVHAIKWIFRRQQWHLNTIEKRLWVVFVISALISFGLPFTLHGMEETLDYTGPFKQFRSIGRIAWLSFYAINLLAIPYFVNKIQSSQLPINKNIFTSIVLLVVLWEAYTIHKHRYDYSGEVKDLTCHENVRKLPIIQEEYQALLPNPIFHIGSEAFSWDPSSSMLKQSFIISYNYKLPIISTMMSRTPIDQALKFNSILMNTYKVPEVIQDIRKIDTRPILVIQSKESIIDPNPRIDHWIKDTETIYEDDEYIYKKLPIHMFDSISNTTNTPDIDTLHHFVFEKIKSKDGWGFEAPITNLRLDPGQYDFRYWVNVLDHTYVLSTTEIFQYDANHGLVQYDIYGNRDHFDIIDGHQIRIKVSPYIHENTTMIIVKYKKHNHRKRHEVALFGGFIATKQ